MSTELVHRASGTELLAAWNAEQVELLRQQICPGATDAELAWFGQYCTHRVLDPFAGEVIGIMRFDGKAGREVMKIQVTVDGYRTIANRTGLYAGQDEPLYCGEDGIWRDAWVNPTKPPVCAKVGVHRLGWAAPAIGKAHYAEFAQFDRKGNLLPLWAKMPVNQLTKCAERQAFIRGFKEELRAAGVPTDDLSLPSRISMEARAAGLDADGRHALVAEVTNGRTDSTREVDAHEALELRAEIARLRARLETRGQPPEGVDPITGEILDEPPSPTRTRTVVDVGPGHQSVRTEVPDRAPRRAEPLHQPDSSPGREPPPSSPEVPMASAGEQVPPGAASAPDPGPPDDDRLKLLAGLSFKSDALSEKGKVHLRAFLDEVGIGSTTKVKEYTTDQLHVVDAWFDQAFDEPF